MISSSDSEKGVAGAMQHTVLVVCADRAFADELSADLSLAGYNPSTAYSRAQALRLFNDIRPVLVLFDMENMPAEELDIVNFIKSAAPDTEIVVLVPMEGLDEARGALRAGASFYLVKPVPFIDLRRLLDKLARRSVQESKHREIEHQFLGTLMAGSPAMEKLLKLAIKIAPTTSTVLIGGESGTGKEFFARIIHRMSRRPEESFIAANCGAIPDTLFESEFFGHRKGAFTGADRDRRGLVDEAHRGTLFLDEVGELSPAAQVKLLRFLQERTFRRVGDSSQQSADVRILAATNRDLGAAVAEGSFREDLFYRLNVFYLHLPPLRQRRQTIPSLMRLFVHRFNNLLDREITTLSKGAEVILANYDYPGNVRELENIIEHAVVLAENGEITEWDLPDYLLHNRPLLAAPAGPGSDSAPEEICTLAELEKGHIERVLRVTGFNYTVSAARLGISRSTLWRKIKGYRIATPAGSEQK